MAEIGPNTRLRVSPFYNATVQEGVTAFSPYNRMLMPTSYGNPESEYDRLINGVSLWDVGVERQVQLAGPDAGRLAQLLSARDLSTCAVDQGKYVPMCDHRGVLINDPIVLKLAEDKYWLSIADNAVLLWARAVAFERGLRVDVTEPDVSPLAVQGPKADEVVASVFGEHIRDIKFFWFIDAEVDGIPLKIARSGYSKQGGFELYLMDGSRGTDLWNIIREAGAPWQIGPGNPNPAERIEGGMLSYGGDTDDDTNPFEVRLDQYVDLDVDDEVIGIRALREIHRNGPVRQQLGITLHEDTVHDTGHAIWYDISADGQLAESTLGSMTNGIWSPRLQQFIGFALVSRTCKPGDDVVVHKEGRLMHGTLCDLPFI
jgi:aminomethyltransferase